MKFSIIGIRENNNDKSQFPKLDYYEEADGIWELIECILDAFMDGATKVIIGKKEP